VSSSRRRRRARGAPRSFAVAAALLADRAVGEPPVDPHPVAAFGTAMKATERAFYEDTKAAGVLHTAIGVAFGASAGALLRSTALATYLAVAGRSLGEAADEIATPLALGDLAAARDRLPALVGRDPTHLDAAEIARAAVESVAENTTDAIVAPAWWGLVAGAPGALGYRAVNTMDAMVGHHSDRYERYGWASARLDDWANAVPARLTAALVVLARPRFASEIWRAVRDDAPHHPSPNAGVAEAAFAAALGLELGGTNTYGDRVEERARLGSGRPPEVGDIAAAVCLADDVQVLLALIVAGLGVARLAGRPGRRGRRRAKKGR